MKKSLSHLPKLKQNELRLIVEQIRKNVEPEKIILFGSYARGDWVDGLHKQGKKTVKKKSDYDIFVVTKEKKTAKNLALWRDITKKCNKLALSTHARVIALDIQDLNIQLAEGQYFYTDIKKEGCLLYDTSRFKLARKRKLKPAEQKRIAQDYFDQWFKSAESFYEAFEHKFKKRDYKNAAFQLHQAAEHSYKAVLLVFTGESPLEHFLAILGAIAAESAPELKNVFPTKTRRQKDLLELLDSAYIGARYDPDFYITEDELKYLSKHVKKLLELTEKVCTKKINSFA